MCVLKAKGWITLSSWMVQAVSMYSTLLGLMRPPVPIRRTPAALGCLWAEEGGSEEVGGGLMGEEVGGICMAWGIKGVDGVCAVSVA